MGGARTQNEAWSSAGKQLKCRARARCRTVSIRQRWRFLQPFCDCWEMAEHKKHIAFNGKVLILGFGAVGQGTLPLMLRHIDMPREKVSVITAEDWGREIAQEYGVAFRVEPVTRDNYVRILDRELRSGDFLFNASFDVSSL